MNEHLDGQRRLLRVAEIIAPNGPVPVGKSTWWEGVRNGHFPQPIKLGPRITVWRSEDIDALIKHGTDVCPNDLQGDE